MVSSAILGAAQREFDEPRRVASWIEFSDLSISPSDDLIRGNDSVEPQGEQYREILRGLIHKTVRSVA